MKKKKGLFGFIKILIILFLLVIFLLVGVLIGFYLMGGFSEKPNQEKIIQELKSNNPLDSIIAAKTDSLGKVDNDEVIKQAILEFNEEYINYIMLGIGVSYLRNSPVYGNPKLELNIDGENWNTEIISGKPQTKKGAIEKKDLIISMTKEEAVKAILSKDIVNFMKDSVSSGRTNIEKKAGDVELYSKGYLTMYEELSK